MYEYLACACSTRLKDTVGVATQRGTTVSFFPMSNIREHIETLDNERASILHKLSRGKGQTCRQGYFDGRTQKSTVSTRKSNVDGQFVCPTFLYPHDFSCGYTFVYPYDFSCGSTFVYPYDFSCGSTFYFDEECIATGKIVWLYIGEECIHSLSYV